MLINSIISYNAIFVQYCTDGLCTMERIVKPLPFYVDKVPSKPNMMVNTETILKTLR
jgi:hypothetical protein